MHHLSPYYSTYISACRRGLQLSVQLGSPRTAHCASLGICSMQPVGFVPAADCARVVEAYLRIDVPTGRLLVHFTNTSIAPDTRQQHFSGAVFTVRDSYRLPSWVVEQLGLPPSVYRITPGRYPSLEDDAFTSLSVRLSGSVTVSLSVDRLAA